MLGKGWGLLEMRVCLSKLQAYWEGRFVSFE